MLSIKERFARSSHLQLGGNVSAAIDNVSIDIPFNIVLDFDANSKYIKIYMPPIDDPYIVLFEIIGRIDELIFRPNDSVHIDFGLVGSDEAISSRKLIFSGRVIVFADQDFDKEKWGIITKYADERGIYLILRDRLYFNIKDSHSRPRAFISHDSRDKDNFVRDLVDALSEKNCRLWYDDYSLKPGDSLRESIESGLKSCGKCVLVLSKNFISNPGWTKREFNSIFNRELVTNNRIFLPVWLDVSRDEVYEYCPSLIDIVAVSGSLGAKRVAEKLYPIIGKEE